MMMHVTTGKKKEVFPRLMKMSPGSLPSGRNFDPNAMNTPSKAMAMPANIRIFPIGPMSCMITL